MIDGVDVGDVVSDTLASAEPLARAQGVHLGKHGHLAGQVAGGNARRGAPST